MRISVLAIDDDLVVVEKPVGLPTHAPQSDPAPTDLVRLVQDQCQIEKLGVHQRLDRDTSGVIVFARSERANLALAAAFESGSVQKTYLAVVHGVPDSSTGLIDAPLAPAAVSGTMQIAKVNDRLAQAARTRYRVVETSPDKRFTLLELHPATGRTHQLRVHCRHLGHPIVGDGVYDAERPAPRMLLHALRVGLPHPASQTMIEYTSEPPALFRQLAAGLPELWALDDSALVGLLALAAERRMPLTNDTRTTFYRVWHGLGEAPWHPLLGRVTVDRAATTLICSFYDEQIRQTPPRLIEALRHVWPDTTTIYAKYRPRTAARVTEADMAELAPPTPVWGLPQPELAVHELGLTYLLKPADDLSVGLYADMRETRHRLMRLLQERPRRVLNTFAYTCGFGVAATAAAGECVNLDLSRRSLDWGQANYHQNHFSTEQRDFVFGDVFDWLNRWVRQGRRFEMVILDPPSFARAKGKPWRIDHDYAALVELAARLLEPDGMLIACCNHSGMNRRTVRNLVTQGIHAAGWNGVIRGVYGASPIDYPSGNAESHLKIMLVDGAI